MHRARTNLFQIILTIFSLFTITGCESESRGFILPPGDTAAGRQAFLELACNKCHAVVNDIEQIKQSGENVYFSLGGPTTRIHTYGDLVSSIINPSHRISGYGNSSGLITPSGESRMRIDNSVISVQQLIDLTAYLQGKYRVVTPAYNTHYGA